MHSDYAINALFARISADRAKGIAELHKTMPDADYGFVAIEWDFNHAPKSTNWKMLKMIGIDPTEATLAEIVAGLDKWNIKVQAEPGCTDDHILNALKTRILIEEISMIAPTPDLVEYITIIAPIAEPALN
jgi:hypothetical protein